MPVFTTRAIDCIIISIDFVPGITYRRASDWLDGAENLQLRTLFENLVPVDQ